MRQSVVSPARRTCSYSPMPRSHSGRVITIISLARWLQPRRLAPTRPRDSVVTDDGSLAEVMRSLRVHGAGRHQYDCVRVGINGRLDTIQAAILIEKLKIFPEEIAARDRVAGRYSAALADVAIVPRVAQGT